MDPLDVMNYCVIGINIILSMVILNWTICFYLLRDFPQIRPRRPRIPILIGFFNTIFISIDRSQILLHSNLSEPIKYNRWIIINTLCIQTWMLSLFLLCYRGWNLYYDLNFKKSRDDKQCMFCFFLFFLFSFFFG